MNLVKTFKSGQRYMHLCPQDKELSYSFRELKIIKYIKFTTKYLPPIVVALFVMQYYVHTQIAVTTITVLFALSLPIQGIFWLGKRSQSPLPLNLVGWYNHIRQQLIEIDVLPKKKDLNDKLTFEEFMKLLNLSKQHFGSYSGRNDDNSYHIN